MIEVRNEDCGDASPEAARVRSEAFDDALTRVFPDGAGALIDLWQGSKATGRIDAWDFYVLDSRHLPIHSIEVAAVAAGSARRRFARWAWAHEAI
jgi:hypothetical protein